MTSTRTFFPAARALRSLLLSGLLGCLPVTVSCESDVDSEPSACDADLHPGAVGIGLTAVNGETEPLELVPGRRYYIASLTLKANRWGAPSDDFLEWLQNGSVFAPLDWSGMTLARSHWRRDLAETESVHFTETRIYQDAAWTARNHLFRVRVIDLLGLPLTEPITLTRDHFVQNVRGVVGWALGAPARGDCGENLGDYDGWAVTGAGTFTGPCDDTYAVEVTAGGTVDGTAAIRISSIHGDDARAPAPVFDGVPVDLGVSGYGGTILIDAPSASSVLTEGDRWTVRCSADTGAVEAPVPATRAEYSGEAILWSWGARIEAPELTLPTGAAWLVLDWTGSDETIDFPVLGLPEGTVGPGFQADITVGAPADGVVFRPGETVEVRLDLKDGTGRLLHPPNRLPTYKAFTEDRSSGIAYRRLGDGECLAGFSDCFRDMMSVRIAGPTHRIEPHYEADPPSDYFTAGETVPPMGVVMGGLRDPAVWETPVANTFSFTLPDDAEAGTYLVMVKASRVYRGERINRMPSVEIQVGTAERTEFASAVGNCDLCHIGEARLDRLRHGTKDFRLCKICHVPPHHAPFPEAIHTVHFYSAAYPTSPNNCSMCHLESDSAVRTSLGVCASCHGDELMGGQYLNEEPYGQCGILCHSRPQTGHIHVLD